jgi:hypothetical protein
MANLSSEYTDTKNIKHRVEHLIVPSDERDRSEQIKAELLIALTKVGRKIPA